LQRTRAGARPQEIRTAEQALLQARVTRDRTKIEADRDQYLLGKGFIAARQANDSMAAYELAKSAFEQAQSQLDLLKEGARQEDLHAAEERLRSAKDLGAKKISEARVALRQADEAKLTVQAKRSEALAARLTAAEKAADAVAAKAAVQNGEVRSPMAGTVTHRFMNVGDMADPTLPIYEIASSGSTTDFVGQVAPEEAARIKEGMPAEFPNSPNLSGRVVAVGIANMQSGMTAVRLRVVGAKIETGKFATARIILRVLPDAVVIPRACVVTRDTGGVVFVDKGGVAKMTSVRLGPVEGERVAILSGVARGDTVILVGQHELSDGAPVTTKSRAGS
jgi:RND family efflux transporter MFP subunit